MEDCIDMASQAVGLQLWDELIESERLKLIDMKIWLPDVLTKWKNDKIQALNNKLKKKGGKKAAAVLEDNEDEYIE